MNKYVTYAVIILLALNLVNPIASLFGGKVGGTVENFPVWFTNGINIGSAKQFVIDSVGAITTSGNVSLNGTGVNFVNNLVQGGSVTTLSSTSSTYTLTASNVMTSNYLQFTPLSAITTVTLPATTTLFASGGLTVDGMSKTFTYESNATSTVLAAGTGGTLGYTSSTTVAAGKHGIVELIRTSSTAYDALLINVSN